MDLQTDKNKQLPVLTDIAVKEQRPEGPGRVATVEYLRAEPGEPGYDPYNSAPPLPKRHLRP